MNDGDGNNRVAIVGSGLIGRSWAIVFARAGWDVALYDSAEGAVDRAFRMIDVSLRDLEAAELVASAAAVRGHMAAAGTLAAALDGATYVQESVSEDRDIKHGVFSELDTLAATDAILGSSCSTIPGSQFLDVPGRARCLVVHPVNPPCLVPLVELVPTPWTAEEAVRRCAELMTDVGQVPIRINQEIEGFVLNRLQMALVNEAVSLVDQGAASPEDVDKTISHGLGLRWSFMGPFETMDLNAPGGFFDYATRYGAIYQQIGRQLGVAQTWREGTLRRIEDARRERAPGDRITERQAWRLMALIKHKREVDADIGV